VVPSGLKCPEYRPYLRYDFFYACAYCTIAESEARAISFEIDHYEPREERPDVIDDYGNLMYACETCNGFKSDRTTPLEARAHGCRFFRADQDLRSDHFERHGTEVTHKTNVGFFTIEALDLNRQTLRRIRELRERLSECDQYVVDGILSLRSYPVDTLPVEIRVRALKKIEEARDAAEDIQTAIDMLLRDFAKSELIDPDKDSAERAAARKANLKELEGMHPGAWRAPRKRKAQKKRR
jgi:HNH endonuclease